MSELFKPDLSQECMMESQAHLYADRDLPELIAAVKGAMLSPYRFVVAERGNCWFVVECRRIVDDVLVDIL